MLCARYALLYLDHGGCYMVYDIKTENSKVSSTRKGDSVSKDGTRVVIPPYDIYNIP